MRAGGGLRRAFASKRTPDGPTSALFTGFFLFAIQETPYFSRRTDGAG
jgi:hypothetical protein